MKERLQEGKKLEWVTIFLFSVLYLIVSICHEPWFDEAEAWQIAKCASLKEILFDIPHLEGHPPLWHLILAIPAKLGVSFEIGLKSVGFIISFTAAWLMVFRSKLPRQIRLVIPFTYFFFYQYGVIVRPYGLMLVTLLLVGMNLNQWNSHPWKVIVIFGALCLTSAYGVLFAGGICICIVWDLFKEKGIRRLFTEIFSDKRTRALVVLLFFAVLLIIQIYPVQDAYGINIKGKTSAILRLVCAFFTILVDCFISTSSWFRIEMVSMQSMSIPFLEMACSSILGIILWILLICLSSKKSLKYFLIPYSIYTIFCAFVYFSTHHLGVSFIFVLSWAEFICGRCDICEIGKKVVEKLSTTDKDKKLLKISAKIILFACIAIPLYWSVAASINEINNEYCFGRSASKFIKDNELESLNIFCPWNDEGLNAVGSEGNEDYINTYVIGTAVPIVAYFDRNIVSNLNNGNLDAYVHHRTISYEDARKSVEEWRKAGVPDVIINHPNLELVYGDEISYADYTLVWLNKSGFIWKDAMANGVSVIYMRNELLDEYNLEPLNDPWYDYWINGAPITEEMRERYRNGEPLDDIINPILDQMFGPEKKK